jgi:hypothetical protein
MRTVREDREVEDALEEACLQWSRTQEAWDAICWALARDPTCGDPITEAGQARSFVFEGSWAHDMPTITVLYVVEEPYVTIRRARFTHAKTTAGHA